MAGQTELEQIAIQKRNELMAANLYKNNDSDKYKETLKLKLTPDQFIEIEKSQNRFRRNPFANEQCQ